MVYCVATCCAVLQRAVLCRSDGDAPNIGFLHALGGFTYLYTCQDVAFPINHSLRNNTTRRFAAVTGAPYASVRWYSNKHQSTFGIGRMPNAVRSGGALGSLYVVLAYWVGTWGTVYRESDSAAHCLQR